MNRNKQRGLTLISLILIAALLGAALLVAFKCVPVVTEYMAIVRVIKAVADEGDQGENMGSLKRSFDRRAQIDDISSIRGSDLIVYKNAGKVVVQAQYERRVPLVANVSLVFEFNTSSSGK
ncbi:MAG: DUF4845 domain-containing protein [Rhodocyclales bacterium]|nr:DUF4845 domain-containing protein [Rhodocyclales bacterium]